MDITLRCCGFDLKTDKITIAFADDIIGINCVFEIDKFSRKIIRTKNCEAYELPASLANFNNIVEKCIHYDMNTVYVCEAKFKITSEHISFVSQKLIDNVIAVPDKKSGWYMPKLYCNITPYVKCQNNNMLINSIICSHINEIAFMTGVLYARLCECTPGGLFLTVNNCINDVKSIVSLKKHFSVPDLRKLKKYKEVGNFNMLPDIDKLKYEDFKCADNANALVCEHISVNKRLADLITNNAYEKIKTIADLVHFIIMQDDIFDKEYNIYRNVAGYVVKCGIIEKENDIINLSNDDIYSVLRNEQYKNEIREKVIQNRRAANIIKHNPYPKFFDVYGYLYD